MSIVYIYCIQVVVVWSGLIMKDITSTTRHKPSRRELWRLEKEQVLPAYKWVRETLLGTLNRLFVSYGEGVVETETSQPAPSAYANSQGPENRNTCMDTQVCFTQ